MNRTDNNDVVILPNRRLSRDKEIDMQVLIPLGIAVAIIFKVLGADIISKKMMIPSFALLVFLVVSFLKKSKLNMGKRLIEQYFIFIRYMLYKVWERIMGHYV